MEPAHKSDAYALIPAIESVKEPNLSPKELLTDSLYRFTAAFDSQHCQCCPYLSQCPVKKGKKFHYLRYTEKDLRIAQRRAYEETPEFKDRYRWRSGIEGTISEYDRRTGVKYLRVRGLKAVRFSATLKALAVNIFRAAALRLTLEGKKEPGFAACLVSPKLISIVKERFSAFMQIVEKICKQFVEDYFLNPI